MTFNISSCAGDDELLLSGVGVIGASFALPSKRTLRAGEFPDDGVSAVMSELWKLKRPAIHGETQVQAQRDSRENK